MTAADRETIIYFIEAYRLDLEPGAIKVGVADDPLIRLETLQVGNQDRLELVAWKEGTLQEEREIHQAFESHRIRGEWFRSTTELRYWIFKTCDPNVQFGFAIEFLNEITDEMRQGWREAA